MPRVSSSVQEGQSVLLTKKKDGSVGPTPSKVDTKGQKRFGNIERLGKPVSCMFQVLRSILKPRTA